MGSLTDASLFISSERADALSSTQLFQHVRFPSGCESVRRRTASAQSFNPTLSLIRPLSEGAPAGAAGLIPRASQSGSAFFLLSAGLSDPDLSHSLHPFTHAHALSATIFETIHLALARTLSCALHRLRSRKGMHRGASGEGGGQVSLWSCYNGVALLTLANQAVTQLPLPRSRVGAGARCTPAARLIALVTFDPWRSKYTC